VRRLAPDRGCGWPHREGEATRVADGLKAQLRGPNGVSLG
jgi:hypothetical protein